MIKEFTVEEYLDNNNKICEYAIFSDGSKKIIKNDEQYGKYFEVDNELNTKCNNCLRSNFSDRIKDAVDMIKNGNGDCIKSTNLFVRVDKVIYFLDRSIGEKLREKSINGWKNTKFAYTIKFGYKNSFWGYSTLNNKMETISPFDDNKTPIYFENEKEANKYMEDIIEKAKFYAKNIADKVSNISDDNEKDTILDNVINEIEKYSNTEFSIIKDLTFDMLTDDLQLKNSECNLDETGYKITQCIVA